LVTHELSKENSLLTWQISEIVNLEQGAILLRRPEGSNENQADHEAKKGYFTTASLSSASRTGRTGLMVFTRRERNPE
jgi:hypothetical protein